MEFSPKKKTKAIIEGAGRVLKKILEDPINAETGFSPEIAKKFSTEDLQKSLKINKDNPKATAIVILIEGELKRRGENWEL